MGLRDTYITYFAIMIVTALGLCASLLFKMPSAVTILLSTALLIEICVSGVIFYRQLVNPSQRIYEQLRNITKGEGDLHSGYQLFIQHNTPMDKSFAEYFTFMHDIIDASKNISFSLQKMSKHFPADTTPNNSTDLLEFLQVTHQGYQQLHEETELLLNEVNKNQRTYDHRLPSLLGDFSINQHQLLSNSEAVRGDLSTNIEATEQLKNVLNNIQVSIENAQSLTQQTKASALNSAIDAAKAESAEKALQDIANNISSLSSQSIDIQDTTLASITDASKLISVLNNDIQNNQRLITKLLYSVKKNQQYATDVENELQQLIESHHVVISNISEQVETISTILSRYDQTADELLAANSNIVNDTMDLAVIKKQLTLCSNRLLTNLRYLEADINTAEHSLLAQQHSNDLVDNSNDDELIKTIDKNEHNLNNANSEDEATISLKERVASALTVAPVSAASKLAAEQNAQQLNQTYLNKNSEYLTTELEASNDIDITTTTAFANDDDQDFRFNGETAAERYERIKRHKTDDHQRIDDELIDELS